MNANSFCIESDLNAGAQHNVGRIGRGMIIKYPHWSGRRWDLSTTETVKRDLAIHKKWNNPIPKTEVVDRPIIDDGTQILRPPYAIIIEEINGRVLQEADLADPDIREQFKDLIKNSLAIRNQISSTVDFLGFEALGKFVKYLLMENKPGSLGAYNLMIDTRKRIKLIDTCLLDPHRAPFGRKRIIENFADFQHGLLVELVDDRELIEQCHDTNKNPLITTLAEKVVRFTRNVEAKRALAQRIHMN